MMLEKKRQCKAGFTRGKMRRVEPNSDKEHFDQAMKHIFTAGKQIKVVFNDLEKQKQEVRNQVDELLALIEGIPVG